MPRFENVASLLAVLRDLHAKLKRQFHASASVKRVDTRSGE